MTHTRLKRLSVSLTACAALALSACGNSNGASAETEKQQSDALDGLVWAQAPGAQSTATTKGDAITFDVGASSAVKITRSEPLSIAFLQQGTVNDYLKAENKGAQDAARKLGVKLTIFDAQLTPATQLAQLQNVITSGKYNAVMAMVMDSNGECKAFTHDAPAANLLVVSMIQPLCGNGTTLGSDAWSAGTLSHIGGDGDPSFWGALTGRLESEVSKDTPIGLVSGPESTINFKPLIELLQDKSKFNLVDVKYTDYSSNKVLAATQNMLLAHPEIKHIVSISTPNMSTIIASVLRQQGKKDVKIYDAGGDTNSVDLVKKGELGFSAAYFPYTIGACAVQILAAAHDVKSVPRLILNDCRKPANKPAPFVLDRSNVNSFIPEY